MTNLLGNVADAALALKGWGRIVGEGTSREAYLINDVVYKVEHGREHRGMNGNSREWDMYNSGELHSRLPDGCAIPICNAFEVEGRVIIAMEFIRASGKNDDDLAVSNACTILSRAGYRDIHPGNIVINDEAIWLIDFEI